MRERRRGGEVYIYGLGRLEHAVKGGSYEVAPIYIPGVEKLLTGQYGVFAEVNPGKSTWRFGAVRVGPSPLCMTNSMRIWNINHLILIYEIRIILAARKVCMNGGVS